MAAVLAMSTFGWALLAVFFLVVWISLAFWPARVADRKGHSFFGYVVLSLFFFPLSLLMAYMSRIGRPWRRSTAPRGRQPR